MFTNSRFVFVLMVLLSLSVATVYGQKKPNEGNKEKKENSTLPAKTIDFNAELGSASRSLTDLGNLIEDGRKYGEVNTLLSAAMTLFLEEAATKKAARITGKDLLKEATELAEKQQNVTALKTIASLWENTMMGNDKNMAKTVNESITNVEKDLAATRGPGAKVVDVKVENYSAYTIYVYIDGVYKGYVSPGYYVTYANIGLGWTDMYAETDNMWSYSQNKYIYYYWSNSYDLQEYDYTYEADFTWSIY